MKIYWRSLIAVTLIILMCKVMAAFTDTTFESWMLMWVLSWILITEEEK